MSKMSFRSWMIAEIVSEARSHLQCDLSKPAPYLFTGTKVARKCEEPKEIEFVVKSGYVLMRFVKGTSLTCFINRKPYQTNSNLLYYGCINYVGRRTDDA